MRGIVAFLVGASLLIVIAASSVSVEAAEIIGAGSTFVYPILSKWSAAYSARTGDTVNYQSIGSGGGITKIKGASVDFGASDMPLKSDELANLGMGQFPLVIGGVVPVVNIEGVQPGELKFTGPLLADIFLGKLRKWNDPAIQAINPGLKLPDTQIVVVYRSDGSGTTSRCNRNSMAGAISYARKGHSPPVISWTRSWLADVKKEGSLWDTSLPLYGHCNARPKADRFQANLARLKAGDVVLCEPAPWASVFIDEMVRFPYHAFDDQVDALIQLLTWTRENPSVPPRIIASAAA